MKAYIETYGCQMNLSDSEIASSVLVNSGIEIASAPEEADIILLNTCSVRENAERTIFKKLDQLRQYRKKNDKLVVGILGCMAERLKSKLIERRDIVGLVVGPDEYRSLPAMIEKAFRGESGIAVRLSKTETYDNIEPLRTNGLSAWVSIMRGCNNFCSYCVVPYTRGRERSRMMASVASEVTLLRSSGYKEITLLGQNVNSYLDPISQAGFPELLALCAEKAPEVRFRFITSNPKDMSERLIETIATYENICNYIHLPVQSGSDRILNLMERKYTAAHYLGRIEKIRKYLPESAVSTDIIAGFPGETQEDHKATLELIKNVRYDGAFMFRYSAREGTKAFQYQDDVPEDEKIRRLNDIIDLQNSISKEINENEVGKVHEVLAEGPSKRNPDEWQGRTGTNKVVIFPNSEGQIKAGDLVRTKIERSTSATLFGLII